MEKRRSLQGYLLTLLAKKGMKGVKISKKGLIFSILLGVLTKELYFRSNYFKLAIGIYLVIC